MTFSGVATSSPMTEKPATKKTPAASRKLGSVVQSRCWIWA